MFPAIKPETAMRALVVLALTAMLLTGCGIFAGPDRKAQLDQLIGKPETDVIRAMGVPNRTIQAEGRQFLAYTDHQWDTFAGYDMFSGYGRYGTLGYRRQGFEADPSLYERYCETTFEIVDNKVASYTLRGTACS
jgi:hypothetical protein